MHTDYLFVLEHTRSLDARLMPDALHGLAIAFQKRRWMIRDGHLASTQIPVLDSEEEVEVEIDEENDTFSFRTPGPHSCILTRPLAEIAFYSINIDAWMDEISSLIGILPHLRARHREVIPEHLWHLGNLRVRQSKHHAPIYIARRLETSQVDWKQALLDLKRPSHGVVLTARDWKTDLPNGHQACSLDRLLISDAKGASCDFALLDRLLQGIAADAGNPEEYFNEITGELKLTWMAEPKIFSGKQLKVIAMLWKARDQSSVKWSDIMARTNCGKDVGSTFGKNWDTCLEREEGSHGYYRLRLRAPGNQDVIKPSRELV